MAKQLVVANADEFLKLLEASEALAPKSLERAREILTGAPDLKNAARTLIKENLITLWQWKQLAGGGESLKFGRYKLLDEIGLGELGRIYVAEHGQLNRRVAIKVLSRRLTSDSQATQRFLSEIRQLSSLDHQNLIRVYDVGQVDDRYYLVMEFVAGRDVGKLVAESGRQSPLDAARLLRQAAAGLAAAHAKGVLHGNLKPSNLLVDEQGVLKLLDLGVGQLGRAALEQPAKSPATNAEDGSHGGELSSNYLAPEQLTGGAASSSTDLYALGAIGSLLLTGQVPPRADETPDPATTVRARLEQPGDVPAELVDLIVGLLDPSPAQRGESMEGVRTKLEAWVRQATPKKGEGAAGAKAEGGAAESAKPPARRPLRKAKSLDDASSLDIGASAEVSPASTDSSPAEAAAPKSERWAITTDEPAAPAPDVPFVIQTKKKPAAKGATKGADKPAATTSRPAATKSAGAAERQKMMLIIGGAVTAGVVVLGLIVALTITFWPSGSESNTPQVAKGAGPAQGAGEENADDTKNPASDATETPAEDGATKDATATDPADKPSDKPAEEKPAEPKPEEKPAPETKPEAKPEPEPKPETPPKPEPKPEPAPPKPPTPPPAPKPVADPFKDFPAVVDLAPPAADAAANQPVALGKVVIDPKAICVVHLLGGSNAFKGKQKFIIEAADNGTALRDWEIRLTDAAAETGGKKVAHLSLKDETLSLQWTPDATTEPFAGSLANCLLRLATGPKAHQVALRTAVTAEPMKFDMLKGGTGKWDIPNMPDPAKVQLEFSLEGPFPPYSLDGVQPVTADKGSISFVFALGDKPEDKQVLALKLDVSTKKNLQASVSTYFKPVFATKPDKLTKANFGKAQLAIVAQQRQAFAIIEQMKKLNKQDEQSQQQLLQMEGQHNSLLKGVAQLQEVAKLLEEVGEGGRIHVRAYYLADDKKVELLNTGGPAPPAAKPN